MIKSLWFAGIQENELAKFLCSVDGIYDLVRLEQAFPPFSSVFVFTLTKYLFITLLSYL